MDKGVCRLYGGPGVPCTASRPCPREVVFGSLHTRLPEDAQTALELWALMNSLANYDGMSGLPGWGAASIEAFHMATDGEAPERKRYALHLAGVARGEHIRLMNEKRKD